MDVKLTYFKQSGKYYSEGTLQVTTTKPWEIYTIVRQLLKTRRLPELVDNHDNYIVLVDIPDGVPAVITEPRLIAPELTPEQQTMRDLLDYPNAEGLHPNEARWRDFARATAN